MHHGVILSLRRAFQGMDVLPLSSVLVPGYKHRAMKLSRTRGKRQVAAGDDEGEHVAFHGLQRRKHIMVGSRSFILVPSP